MYLFAIGKDYYLAFPYLVVGIIVMGD